MTSMTVAPAPMRAAHLKPRLAPSFRMLRLMGPTGMEMSSPLMKPVPMATAVGGRSMRSGRRRVIVVFLVLDFIDDFFRDARADKAVNEIGGEEHGQDEDEEFVLQYQGGADEEDADERFGEGAGGAEVEFFEGRIFHFAHHHEREEEHDGGKDEAHVALRETLFVVPHHEHGERRDEAGRRRDGKAQELLAAAAAGHGGETVESRQTKRAANQVNRRDKPAGLRVRAEH